MNDLTEKTSTPRTAPVTLARDDRDFVFAVARRILGSAADVEDVTQDALLLAHRYRDSFRGEASYRTWLYRIATTTALTHLRKGKRFVRRFSVGEDEHVLDVPDPSRSPEAETAAEETRTFVRRALNEVPPKYRDVLVARIDESEAEVAARMGLSVANVKIRAHRARKQLRAAIERLDPQQQVAA
jgi:RNA polymerase sigma-70 factor (ECF subfamily)